MGAHLVQESIDQHGQHPIVGGRIDGEVLQVDELVLQDSHQLEPEGDPLRFVAGLTQELRERLLQPAVGAVIASQHAAG